MKEETKQKNISNYDETEKVMKEWVKPVLSIAIKVAAHGFVEGFGNGDLKDIPHFGVGLVGISKRWTCYIFFEDRLQGPRFCHALFNSIA